MFRAQSLRWLPNALTVARAVLSVPIFLAALNEAWALAFWLLVVALLTDFFDGLAAKKLNAKTAFGEEADGLADSSLVVAGLIGLAAAGELSWWFAVAVLATGAVIGSDRVFRSQHTKRPYIRMVMAVSSLFIAWIGIGWYFAALAFGWSWWYVPLTAFTLLVLASLKRHRIRAWLGRQ